MTVLHRVVGGLLLGLILTTPAQAQNYPAKNVRVMVPFAAGGPTDVIGRLIAQKLSESWGQQFVVENLPGAGGNTGTAQAARAARRWARSRNPPSATKSGSIIH